MKKQVKHMRRLKEGKNYFYRVCLYRIVPVSCDNNVYFFLVLGGRLLHGIFISCFLEEKG